MTLSPFEFSLPTRVVFGPGTSTERLGPVLESAAEGAGRVFVVSDPGIEAAGIGDRVRAGLEGAAATLAARFSDVPPDSSVQVVESAAAVAREAGCDRVLAIGGGSVMDTAKAVSILLGHGGSIRDHQGLGVVKGPLPPVVAIPTTAGTGSEVSPYAVIKDVDAHAKLHFVSRHLFARTAILDPELTTSLPPGLSSATGADALTHAVESYVSRMANPVSDALALGAARDVVKWLPRVMENGKDLEARGHMLLASLTAGAAMGSAAVGCVHAMAHALGGLHGVHHGVANALCLVQGIRFNAEAAGERLETLCRTIFPDAPKPGAETLAGRLEPFLAELDLPPNLREVGVPEDGLEAVAAAAAMDGALFTNPRMAGAGDLLPLLRAAW